METTFGTHERRAHATAAGRAEASFERFFQGEFARLYRALVIVTRDLAEAEDVAQEAFGRLWERWERVSALDDPQGYLYRTALNAYFQRRRRVARFARRVVAPPAAERDPLTNVETRDQLERALLSLPARQRAALVVTELLGHDSAGAATILGIRPGTVRTLVSQAKARLRDGREES